ncbi:MAG: tRNA pseudouridine(13) synthase TruD [Haloferacaceae archaeon]
MRRAHPAERPVGIEWYASDADGTGGRLRDRPEDFRVRELERDLDPAPADADRGDYPHLLVRATLRRWDTNDFAARLSDALGVSRERVSWAGTKDKHAVTTQLFSLRDVDAGDLPDVRDADLTVLGRVGRALTFGDLAGNAFEVRVAEPETPEAAAAVTADLRAFAGLDEGNGDGPGATVAVPNYFGHQRFGSRRPVTHEVGLRVLRRDWRGAVLAYCGNPAETEPDDTREARGFVDEQAASDDPDWGRAAERLPRALGHERAMLNRLTDADETPADWRRALEAVPSNLQRLFVNAAQSYAFNRIVSERMARGLPLHEPVPGDVVCFADRDAPADLALPDPDRTQRVDADRVDVVARHCRRGRAFVTAPLVGTETTFAGGEPGEIAREVCDELGIAPADFDLPGEFASWGTRRAVCCRTDVRVASDPLRFTFALPSGSYATTLLREYLKRDPREL